VAVCFAQGWNPPALFAAQMMEKVRMGGDVGQLAQIFIVDADKEMAAVWELGVVATPAIAVYSKGKAMTFRRGDRVDDIKLVGDQIGDQEAIVGVLRSAKEASRGGGTIVNLA